MKSLPAQTVEILRLRFYRDHSIEDIAQILDIGLSAAKMRLYRSLRQTESLIPDQEQRLFA
jgi:RNA polymerase sigma-70 factor (ECF subfamily)